MKFENTKVMNFDGAFRGLRNPMNSWAKSDSASGIYFLYGDECEDTALAWMTKKYPDLEEGDKEWHDRYDKIADWLCQNAMLSYDPESECSNLFFIGPNDMDLAQRMIAAGSPNDKFIRQIFVSVDITAPLYW